MLSEVLRTISLLTDDPEVPATSHNNSAWTRLALSLDSTLQGGDELVEKARRALEYASQWPEASEHALEPTVDPATLRLRILRRNEQGHLVGLKRQGQLSNEAFDEKQRKMTEFFGGAVAGVDRGQGKINL
jgi:hypothetical protein